MLKQKKGVCVAQAGKSFVISWQGVAVSGEATPLAGSGKVGPVVALTSQEAYQYVVRELSELHGVDVRLRGYRIREAAPGEF